MIGVQGVITVGLMIKRKADLDLAKEEHGGIIPNETTTIHENKFIKINKKNIWFLYNYYLKKIKRNILIRVLQKHLYSD